MTVLNLDCRHGLAMLPDNSVDAILTDPPYELGFMGHSWDSSGIAYDVAVWREALRVLKPGGHMLAFSGSRTYHRMACAIEDAGFTVRDSIMWVYGSGFPKSLDVSKALDKLFGAERQVIGQQFRAATGRDEGYGFGESFDLTAPATLVAQLWEGWGTALKPAHEPICVARKPLAAKTVAENLLHLGVGALNIDGCRVATDDGQNRARPPRTPNEILGGGKGTNLTASEHNDAGRWPANVIHDGSPEVLALFPQAPGQLAKASTADTLRAGQNVYGTMLRGSNGMSPRDDAGSAARFFQACPWAEEDLERALLFYCAKASKREKGEGNTHPTVKPVALGRYLARLICPPGGTLLDIFAGSGSFGVSAALEGFTFLGFDSDPASAAIANARLMSPGV